MKAFKRNVFVLGAGFSKPAQAPVMSEFFDALQGCYFDQIQQLSPADKEAFVFVLKFRQEIAKVSDVFDVNLDNLEQLFGLLEMQVAAGTRSSADRRHFVWALLRTLEMVIRGPNHPIRHETQAELMGPDHSVRRLRELRIENRNWLYHAFGSMLGQTHFQVGGRKDAVITFNYDLLLDRALCDLGFKVDYSLGATSYSGDYHTKVDSFTETAVPLYKVHGSANWIRCECAGEHAKGVFIAAPWITAEGIGERVLERSLGQCPMCNPKGGVVCKDQATQHTPVIVPPTWNKAGYQQLVQPVWIAALKALEQAHRITVIGFSLPETDIFFRYMLMAGVQVGQGVELWVYDKDPSVFPRYQEFLAKQFQQSRFKPQPVEFGSAGFGRLIGDLNSNL